MDTSTLDGYSHTTDPDGRRTSKRRSDGRIESVADGDDGDADEILVLDAHKNAAVVLSRALAAEGVDVTIGGWSRLSPGMLSRHVNGRFIYPSPYQHPEHFITELTEHLRTNDYLAVIPITDLSHVLLSKHKRRLEESGTIVGTETWETFVSANNKKSLAALLEDLSVPGPYSRAPDSVDGVAGMKDEFSYPVVIKPQYTTVKTEDGTYIEARVSEENYVHHPDELAATYRSLVEKYPYFATDLPIIQEVISGAVMATCGVAESGEFVEYFQEERLRMFPVDGGSSALRRGICHPDMAEAARKVVDALDWTGPIYVEFIHAPDGDCYVLEVNGRYWGSVGCAICGGVNVPALHYQQLKGTNPTSDQQFRIGRRQRRLFYTDIKWLTAQLDAGNVGAIVPFLRSFLEADHDLLAVDDPLPAAGAVLWGAQEMLRRNGPTKTITKRTPDIAAKVAGLFRGFNR